MLSGSVLLMITSHNPTASKNSLPNTLLIISSHGGGQLRHSNEEEVAGIDWWGSRRWLAAQLKMRQWICLAEDR